MITVQLLHEPVVVVVVVVAAVVVALEYGDVVHVALCAYVFCCLDVVVLSRLFQHSHELPV
ncbi:hypothetical protein D3C85_1831890 [compost metagenome]